MSYVLLHCRAFLEQRDGNEAPRGDVRLQLHSRELPEFPLSVVVVVHEAVILSDLNRLVLVGERDEQGSASVGVSGGRHVQWCVYVSFNLPKVRDLLKTGYILHFRFVERG